jgi:hypothetical protein
LICAKGRVILDVLKEHNRQLVSAALLRENDGGHYVALAPPYIVDDNKVGRHEGRVDGYRPYLAMYDPINTVPFQGAARGRFAHALKEYLTQEVIDDRFSRYYTGGIQSHVKIQVDYAPVAALPMGIPNPDKFLCYLITLVTSLAMDPLTVTSAANLLQGIRVPSIAEGTRDLRGSLRTLADGTAYTSGDVCLSLAVCGIWGARGTPGLPLSILCESLRAELAELSLMGLIELGLTDQRIAGMLREDPAELRPFGHGVFCRAQDKGITCLKEIAPTVLGHCRVNLRATMSRSCGHAQPFVRCHELAVYVPSEGLSTLSKLPLTGNDAPLRCEECDGRDSRSVAKLGAGADELLFIRVCGDSWRPPSGKVTLDSVTVDDKRYQVLALVMYSGRFKVNTPLFVGGHYVTAIPGGRQIRGSYIFDDDRAPEFISADKQLPPRFFPVAILCGVASMNAELVQRARSVAGSWGQWLASLSAAPPIPGKFSCCILGHENGCPGGSKCGSWSSRVAAKAGEQTPPARKRPSRKAALADCDQCTPAKCLRFECKACMASDCVSGHCGHRCCRQRSQAQKQMFSTVKFSASTGKKRRRTGTVPPTSDNGPSSRSKTGQTGLEIVAQITVAGIPDRYATLGSTGSQLRWVTKERLSEDILTDWANTTSGGDPPSFGGHLDENDREAFSVVSVLNYRQLPSGHQYLVSFRKDDADLIAWCPEHSAGSETFVLAGAQFLAKRHKRRERTQVREQWAVPEEIMDEKSQDEQVSLLCRYAEIGNRSKTSTEWVSLHGFMYGQRLCNGLDEAYRDLFSDWVMGNPRSKLQKFLVTMPPTKPPPEPAGGVTVTASPPRKRARGAHGGTRDSQGPSTGSSPNTGRAARRCLFDQDTVKVGEPRAYHTQGAQKDARLYASATPTPKQTEGHPTARSAGNVPTVTGARVGRAGLQAPRQSLTHPYGTPSTEGVKPFGDEAARSGAAAQTSAARDWRASNPTTMPTPNPTTDRNTVPMTGSVPTVSEALSTQTTLSTPCSSPTRSCDALPAEGVELPDSDAIMTEVAPRAGSKGYRQMLSPTAQRDSGLGAPPSQDRTSSTLPLGKKKKRCGTAFWSEGSSDSRSKVSEW